MNLNDRVNEKNHENWEALNIKRYPQEYNEILVKVKEELQKSNSLKYQINRIKESGGISQESALSLKEVDDRALTIPIPYFTTHTSRSHVHIALETSEALQEQLDRSVIDETTKLLEKLVEGLFIAPDTKSNSELDRVTKFVRSLDINDPKTSEFLNEFESILNDHNVISMRLCYGRYDLIKSLKDEVISYREKLNIGLKAFTEGKYPEINQDELRSVNLQGLLFLADNCSKVEDRSDILELLLNYLSYQESLNKDIKYLYDILADINNVDEYPKMIMFFLDEEVNDICKFPIAEFILNIIQYFLSLEILLGKIKSSIDLINNNLIQITNKYEV